MAAHPERHLLVLLAGLAPVCLRLRYLAGVEVSRGLMACIGSGDLATGRSARPGVTWPMRMSAKGRSSARIAGAGKTPKISAAKARGVRTRTSRLVMSPPMT